MAHRPMERPANWRITYTVAGETKVAFSHKYAADAAKDWFLRLAADMGVKAENVRVEATDWQKRKRYAPTPDWRKKKEVT